MGYKLDPSEPLRQGLRRVADEVLGKAIQTISEARAEGVAVAAIDEAVHDVRKTTKNVRALLRMFRPGLGETYAVENKALRDAARGLSFHRDRRVVRDTIRELIGSGMQDVDAVTDRVAPAREENAPDLRDSLEATESSLRTIRGRVSGWNVKRARRCAAEGIQQVYRQGRIALRQCGSRAPDTRWHELRKHVKYHWNHARLMRDHHPVVEDYATRFGELAQTLGNLQDMAILLRRLDAEPDTTFHDLSVLREAADARAADLRGSASRVGAALYAVKPRAIGGLAFALLDP